MPLTDVANVTDVTLGGRKLQLVDGSYREFAISPFAPRIATANPSHGTLDAWQSDTISDWSHGFGFQDALDMQGYNFSVGNIDTRTAHELRLAPTVNAVANPVTVVTCMADAYPATNSGLYIGLSASQNSTTVYRFDGSTMAAVNGASCPATIVTDLISSANGGGGNMLFVALSDTSDVAFKTWNGSAWDTPVANGYAKYFAIAGGYMWYADRTNNVYYSSDPTVNGGWSAAIAVGWKHHKITSLCEFNGQLYVGKENGLYVVEGVGTGAEAARSVIVFRDQSKPSDNRMNPLVEWNGYLYFRFWDIWYRMAPGGAIAEVTPPRFGVTFPYVRYSSYRGFAPGGRWLYYAAKRSDTSATDLIAFDGVAHHRLAQITAALNGTAMRGVYLSDVAANPRLWVSAANGATGTLSYINLNNYPLPYDDYPTTGTHYLETSRFDMSLPEVVKSWKDVMLEMENIASGRYAEVKFATDDNTAFTSLGTGQTENGNAAGTAGTAAVVNGGGPPWTNLTATTAADGNAAQATFAVGGNTDYLKLTNFGFAIPTTALITGFEVSVTRFVYSSFSESVYDYTVQLVIGGSGTGTNKADTTVTKWPWNVPVARTYGSSTDTWGTTPTVAQVNASDFGVQIAAQIYAPPLDPLNYVGVDYVTITVYYSNFSRYVSLTFPRKDGTVSSATSTTLTDTANLTEADDTWDGATVDIVSGTGAGQTRLISSYNGGNATCTMLEAWDTTPDTTSRYQITWQSRKIRYRLQLTTGSATNSPVVKTFTQRFQPRPPLKRGFKFTVKAADLLENNTGAIPAQYGAEELKDLIFYWRDVKAPLQFVNKDNETLYAEVTEANAVEVYTDPQSPSAAGNREYQIAMSLVES